MTKPNNMKKISELFSKEIESIISKKDQYLISSNLDKKEFSIFDRVELKKTGKELRFLVLKIANISLLPFKHISRVVNTLYLLYGADDNGKGKFSEADIDELNNNEAVWIGRSWLQTESNLQPAMIRCDDNEGLKLFVMNV
jgi:hypothetical protein